MKFSNNKNFKRKKIVIISVQIETFGLRSLTFYAIYRFFFAVFMYLYLSVYLNHNRQCHSV